MFGLLNRSLTVLRRKTAVTSVQNRRKQLNGRSSALPLVFLGGQLACGFQIFVDEFILCSWEAGLISAVVHGVLAFTLDKYVYSQNPCHFMFYLDIKIVFWDKSWTKRNKLKN